MLNIKLFSIKTPCALCKLPCERKSGFCFHCEKELPWILSPCLRCGRELPEKNLLCGKCQQTPPAFDKAMIPFRYSSPISQYISRLKFSEKCHYAPLFAYLFQQYLHENRDYSLPQALIPVPLHSKRLKNRGYNQALEIARPLAKSLKIPLLNNACIRHRHTQPQTEMSSHERKSNVKNAFVIKDLPIFPHVAVMDDVFTTGFTLEEIVKCLKKNGVEKVDVWCIAKAFQ